MMKNLISKLYQEKILIRFCVTTTTEGDASARKLMVLWNLHIQLWNLIHLCCVMDGRSFFCFTAMFCSTTTSFWR